MCGVTFDKPDLVVLRISHVINREAQHLLYSESIFRYSIPSYEHAAPKPQKEDVNRMKKIEIYMGGGPFE